MHIIRPVLERANEWGRPEWELAPGAQLYSSTEWKDKAVVSGVALQLTGEKQPGLAPALILSLFVCVVQRGSLTQIPVVKETRVESGQFLLLSVLCMLFILVALAVSGTFFCVRQRSHLHMKEKLASFGTDTSTDATATYQVRATPRCQPITGRGLAQALWLEEDTLVKQIFWNNCYLMSISMYYHMPCLILERFPTRPVKAGRVFFSILKWSGWN